jgi:hypothetical protein
MRTVCMRANHSRLTRLVRAGRVGDDLPLAVDLLIRYDVTEF